MYPLPQPQPVAVKLGAAKSMDEIAQALTAAGVRFTRASKKIDTAIFPHALYEQVAKVPAGEPFIAPGGDKAVANVITAREPAPLTGDQARAVALNAMRQVRANTVVQDRVKDLRAKAKIEYQPGFAPPAKK